MDNKKTIQLVVLCILIIGIWIYGYTRYREFRAPAPESRPVQVRPDDREMVRRETPERQRADGEPREAGVERIRQMAREDLNLTGEQERQLEQVFQNQDLTWEQRREAFEQVLTPQQREQINERREEFRARGTARRAAFEQRAERLLSDSERAAMREMMERRRAERGERGQGRRESR